MVKRLLLLIGLSVSLFIPVSAMQQSSINVQDEECVQRIMSEMQQKDPVAYDVIQQQLQQLNTRVQELQAQGASKRSLLYTTVVGCLKVFNFVITCGLFVSGAIVLTYVFPLISEALKNGGISRNDLERLAAVIRCDAFRLLCKLPFGTCSIPWTCYLF
jgi:predicted PurR-regulated permease PerM